MDKRNEIFRKREYNALDILKLVLSVLVMLIHTGIDKTVISPLLRIAVPLFFIISSYFFFLKIEKMSDEQGRRNALIHFVKRNLLLYLLWSAVQLPIILYVRGYYRDFSWRDLLLFLKELLLGSSFTGSWYIMALVIGTVFIYYLSKKISPARLVVITLPIYVLCCFATNYWNLFEDGGVLHTFILGYRKYMGVVFYTSFPVSFFWISVGCLFAKWRKAFKFPSLIVMLAASALLLAAERVLIVMCGLAVTDDCYFSLMLFCPVLFLLVRQCGFTLNSRFRIREISVLIYVTHGAVGRVIGFLLKKAPWSIFHGEAPKLILSFLLIVLLGQLVTYLKDRYSAKIFRYLC